MSTRNSQTGRRPKDQVSDDGVCNRGLDRGPRLTEESFNDKWGRWSEIARAACRRWCGDEHDASDDAQGILVGALDGIRQAKFSSEDELAAYINICARRRSVDRLRAQYRRRAAMAIYAGIRAAPREEADTPSDYPGFKSMAACLQAALAPLSNREIDVLYSRFALDLSHPEIAKMLKITPNHSAQIVSRALKAARETLRSIGLMHDG